MKVDDGGALVRYGDAHVALFLHHGGESLTDGVWRSFAIAHPVLLDRMISSVRQQADEAGICDLSTELNVRCIELHTYRTGAGLMDRDHKDSGSALSMSVMLSEASAFDGGTFLTWERDTPVPHPVERGDGVLFRSEDYHNVSPVTRGMRQVLVVELWAGPPNKVDRNH